ncbi:alkaline serine protease [Colletotrichum truncatum]|uniref:Alkaline serine protease n=1 Tax=Colletotrichum truncatum TaxID=5467 RepID=A0ACC3ZLK5_COLTU|nr:alkaline serine protease [Colletotrichum truncatum]KAF6783955.1 alkaline serine protease [Colletotrichum truncatum]
MKFTHFVTLVFTLVSVCFAQQSQRRSASSIPVSSWGNSTFSRPPLVKPSSARSSFHSRALATPSASSAPVTPAPVSTTTASRTSSAPPTTVTVSNGENIVVAAGVVVVGGALGGSFTLNGVTTVVPAGASIVAGSGQQNPSDPENPDEKASRNPDQKTTQPEPSQAPSSSAQVSGTETTSNPVATPSGTAAEYIIFAKKGTNKADADGFGNTLKSLLGETKISLILNTDGVPFMWRTDLTPSQLDKVKADRVVAGVVPNKKETFKDPTPDPADTDPEADPAYGSHASGSATVQKRADATQVPTSKNKLFDLRTLSTPPKTDGILPNFMYEDPAGEGITIYHIDLGPFALDHDEFSSDSGATRRTIDVNEEDVADPDHGTCAASKAVGKTTGTAKRSNLVAVRIDEDGWGVIAGLQAAANDIYQKKLQGKAVVSISVTAEADEKIIVDYVREVVGVLVGMDVPVICPAGNNGTPEKPVEVNTLPGTLAKEFPVIVVGSASRRLEKSWFSQQGDLLTTWAVGENIRCANFNNPSGLKFDTGTSFAGPQVAGIAAYFLSHPDFNTGLRQKKVAADMRDLIGATSFPRITEPGYPPIAWNLWGSQQACSANTAATRRMSRRSAAERRALPACSFAPSSAPATARPTSGPSAVPSAPVKPSGSASKGPTTTTTSITETVSAGPQKCGVCGAQAANDFAGKLGGQVGCSGADYARQSCENDPDCKSWAFGMEDRQTYSIEVCLLFSESATQVVSQAPPDPEGKCPFKYHDKGCPTQ